MSTVDVFTIPFSAVDNSSNNLLVELYQHSTINHPNVNNLILLYGGENNLGYWTNQFLIINVNQVKSIEWDKPLYTSFPPKKDGHVICYFNNKIYVFFGSDNQELSGNNNAIYSLQLDNLQWKVELKSSNDVNNIPKGRTQFAKYQLNNSLYVFGGKKSALHETSMILNDFWCFDFENMKWIKKSNLINNKELPNLSGCSLIPSKNGKYLFLYGGFDGNNYSNDLYRYSIENNSWEHLTNQLKGDIPEGGRERHCSILLPNTNEMFIQGGWQFGGVTNKAYTLQLDNLTWKEVLLKDSKEEVLKRYGHSANLLTSNNGKDSFIFLIGGKDLSMNNRKEGIIFSLNNKLTNVNQVIESLQVENNNGEWKRFKGLNSKQSAPKVDEEIISELLGVKLNKPIIKQVNVQPTVIQPPTTSSNNETKSNEQPIEVKPKVVEVEPKVEQKVEPIEIETNVEPEIEPNIEPKIETTNEVTSTESIEATQPIVVQGSTSTAAPNTSVNYLSEKLQAVDDKPKLQTIKKPLRKAVGGNRKPKTTNTNLVKSLDKLEAEVTVDIPSEEKFSQLEQEAKKIEPVQEEKSKIPKGGVSMFGGLPMGMGGNMMGELAAKLKKKQ
ncbi:hypothetical protein ABK040_005828 [Willaertia magna]